MLVLLQFSWPFLWSFKNDATFTTFLASAEKGLLSKRLCATSLVTTVSLIIFFSDVFGSVFVCMCVCVLILYHLQHIKIMNNLCCDLAISICPLYAFITYRARRFFSNLSVHNVFQIGLNFSFYDFSSSSLNSSLASVIVFLHTICRVQYSLYSFFICTQMKLFEEWLHTFNDLCVPAI